MSNTYVTIKEDKNGGANSNMNKLVMSNTVEEDKNTIESQGVNSYILNTLQTKK